MAMVCPKQRQPNFIHHVYFTIGYMAYPVPWHNSLGYGLTLGQLPDPAWSMDFDGVDYPPDYLPEEKCEGGKPPCMENWMYESGVNEAFTNYTFIPGEPTLGGYSIFICLKIQCLKENLLATYLIIL